MGKTLNGLIAHVIDRIALTGQYGACPSDFITAVRTYYDQDNTGIEPRREAAESTQQPERRPNINRPFLEYVWKRICKDPDIQVGEHCQYQNSTLAEAEASHRSINLVNLAVPASEYRIPTETREDATTTEKGHSEASPTLPIGQDYADEQNPHAGVSEPSTPLERNQKLQDHLDEHLLARANMQGNQRSGDRSIAIYGMSGTPALPLVNQPRSISNSRHCDPGDTLETQGLTERMNQDEPSKMHLVRSDAHHQDMTMGAAGSSASAEPPHQASETPINGTSHMSPADGVRIDHQNTLTPGEASHAAYRPSHRTHDSPMTEGNELDSSESVIPNAEGMAGIRIFASEDRVWPALTGHGPDLHRVKALDFVLLSMIAVCGPKGILQQDMVRISGQDKRSLPHRTDRLHEEGYIVKKRITVLVSKGSHTNKLHTSLCTLKRFVQLPEHHRELQRLAREANEKVYKKKAKNKKQRDLAGISDDDADAAPSDTIGEPNGDHPTPQWLPDRSTGNQVYDVIDRFGKNGATLPEIRDNLFGPAYKKPVEFWTARLVDAWQISQPLHLRHLAILRDTVLKAKSPVYIHYTLPNFRELVDTGKASWAAVTTISPTVRVGPHISASLEDRAELDEHGFPKLELEGFQGVGCDATLAECAGSARLVQGTSKSKRYCLIKDPTVSTSEGAFEATNHSEHRIRRKKKKHPPPNQGHVPEVAHIDIPLTAGQMSVRKDIGRPRKHASLHAQLPLDTLSLEELKHHRISEYQAEKYRFSKIAKEIERRVSLGIAAADAALRTINETEAIPRQEGEDLVFSRVKEQILHKYAKGPVPTMSELELAIQRLTKHPASTPKPRKGPRNLTYLKPDYLPSVAAHSFRVQSQATSASFNVPGLRYTRLASNVPENPPINHTYTAPVPTVKPRRGRPPKAVKQAKAPYLPSIAAHTFRVLGRVAPGRPKHPSSILSTDSTRDFEARTRKHKVNIPDSLLPAKEVEAKPGRKRKIEADIQFIYLPSIAAHSGSFLPRAKPLRQRPKGKKTKVAFSVPSALEGSLDDLNTVTVSGNSASHAAPSANLGQRPLNSRTPKRLASLEEAMARRYREQLLEISRHGSGALAARTGILRRRHDEPSLKGDKYKLIVFRLEKLKSSDAIEVHTTGKASRTEAAEGQGIDDGSVLQHVDIDEEATVTNDRPGNANTSETPALSLQEPSELPEPYHSPCSAAPNQQIDKSPRQSVSSAAGLSPSVPPSDTITSKSGFIHPTTETPARDIRSSNEKETAARPFQSSQDPAPCPLPLPSHSPFSSPQQDRAASTTITQQNSDIPPDRGKSVGDATEAGETIESPPKNTAIEELSTMQTGATISTFMDDEVSQGRVSPAQFQTVPLITNTAPRQMNKEHYDRANYASEPPHRLGEIHRDTLWTTLRTNRSRLCMLLQKTHDQNQTGHDQSPSLGAPTAQSLQSSGEDGQDPLRSIIRLDNSQLAMALAKTKTPSTKVVDLQAASNRSDLVPAQQAASLQSSPVPTPSKPKNTSSDTGKIEVGRLSRTGGSTAMLRKSIILELIQKCGGASPGHRELYVPFAVEWNKRGQPGQPEINTIRTTINALCSAGKLRQLTFAYKTSEGLNKYKTMVSLPEIEPSDHRIKHVQDEMRRAGNRTYLPKEWLFENTGEDANKGPERIHIANPLGLKQADAHQRFGYHQSQIVKQKEKEQLEKNKDQLEKAKQAKRLTTLKQLLEVNPKRLNPEATSSQVSASDTGPGKPTYRLGTLSRRGKGGCYKILPRVPTTPRGLALPIHLPGKQLQGTFPGYAVQDPVRQIWNSPAITFVSRRPRRPQRTQKPAPNRRFRPPMMRSLRLIQPKLISPPQLSPLYPKPVEIVREPSSDEASSEASESSQEEESFSTSAILSQCNSTADPQPAPTTRPAPTAVTSSDAILLPALVARPGPTPRSSANAVPLPAPTIRPAPILKRSSNALRPSAPVAFQTLPSKRRKQRNPKTKQKEGFYSSLIPSYMDPKRLFYPSTGTFSSGFNGLIPVVVSTHRAAKITNSVQAYQRQWEDFRPVEDPDMVRSMHSIAMKPRFEVDVDRLLEWEVTVPHVEDLQYLDWTFIHYHFPHQHSFVPLNTVDMDDAKLQVFSERSGRLVSKSMALYAERDRSKRLKGPSPRGGLRLGDKRRSHFLSREEPGRSEDEEDEADELPVRKGRSNKRRRKDGPYTRVSLDQAEGTRLLTAVIAVRCLTGGVDKRCNWFFVNKALDKEYDRIVLRSKWKQLQDKLGIGTVEKAEEDFQQLFAKAYQEDSLPPIDFENLKAYPWKLLVERFMEKNEPPPALTSLPSDRSAISFEDAFDETPEHDLNRYYELDNAIVTRARRAALNRHAWTRPIGKTVLQQQPQENEFAVARTWVRANVIASQGSYNSSLARTELLKFPESIIEKAFQSLIADKIISQNLKRRLNLHRTYSLHEQTLSRLQKTVLLSDLRRAASFKAYLDLRLARNGSLAWSQHAQNGEAIVVFNLLANKHITLRTKDVPLNKWGQTEGSYETRQMDKTKLFCNTVILPRPNYSRGNPLFPLPPPPSQHLAEAMNTKQKIPLWYDIHGRLTTDLWGMALTAIMCVIHTRPGICLTDLAKSVGPMLEQWEVEWVTKWIVQAGAGMEWMSAQGKRFRTKIWWWLVLATGEEDGAAFAEDGYWPPIADEDEAMDEDD